MLKCLEFSDILYIFAENMGRLELDFRYGNPI